MISQQLTVSNEVELQNALKIIDAGGYGYDIKIIAHDKQRTITQNAAMHKLFELLAVALNDSGYEMKKVLLENEIEIPWSPSTVKECLWKPVQKIMTDKISTAEQSTVDVNEVYNVLDRHLSSKFGVHVEFPSYR